jgi:hypothetical protein
LASVLLALFVVGGLVLPTMHRAQHAMQAAAASSQASEAAHDHATHDHAAHDAEEMPAWAADAAGHLHACDLCAAQLHVRLAPALPAPTLPFVDADLMPRVASFVAHVGAAARLIRGPPSRPSFGA